ncbi:HSP70 gene product [Grapevine leafroll-associated virus 5]|uniref:Heat shock protein 70 n=3 Tax=Grapevine leafroll-associated virus 4 TaxID=70177 RepID=A0A5A4DQW0_9CLOS|nr:HSP70 gene product [Grapevine leafroll-associated virus 5]ARP51833.1 heat shock protein 70 [Grapevine leafroll-associated virus 4]CBZ41629.1 heat shock protein 70 homolog [Grapevine leafroll-associated virus 5]
MEVGIDFGTTFSTLCFSAGRGVDGCVPESDTVYIPTVVGIRKDGTYTIGLGALLEKDVLVYRDIKRYFGMNKFNAEVYKKKLKPKFEVIVKNWSAYIGPSSGEKGKTRSVIALACMFVSALAKMAVSITGSAVKLSVCSVPAEYSSYMRNFIFQGCNLAKIQVQAVVNEPTAAGLSAFVTVDKNSIEYMVVYDFGGGTFDASLMAVGSSYVCVVDSLGDNYLGGRDVDNALLDVVVNKLNISESSLDPFSMEALKIDMVDNPLSTTRRVLTKTGEVKTLRFDNQQFRSLCEPFVERARAIIERLLKRNGVTSCVAVLIGGSSVLPGVRNSVAGLKEISRVIFDKETYRAAVAIGAAIYAQTFTGVSRYRLIDCVSNSLSDERQPLQAITVFPKGHPIPSTVAVNFKMPTYNTGVVLHEGESSFINENARTYSAPLRTSQFPGGRTYVNEFKISEDGRLDVTMNGVPLINEVVPERPLDEEYSEVFLSSDDKRIKPEVNDIKLFYSKILNQPSLSTKDLAARREEYIKNGIVCD